MTTEAFATAATDSASIGRLKEMPTRAVIFLVLLAALSFTAGLMFPEVIAGLGLLF
ncbi:MAG TPA: hypothetical protein VL244_03215 [Alphaproteobacteria bacterium]|nr:hypothetical protein [Alphaproteobacteria bacterium]